MAATARSFRETMKLFQLSRRSIGLLSSKFYCSQISTDIPLRSVQRFTSHSARFVSTTSRYDQLQPLPKLKEYDDLEAPEEPKINTETYVEQITPTEVVEEIEVLKQPVVDHKAEVGLFKEKIDDTIMFYSLSSTKAEKPVVVIYSWLQANKKHVYKFRDFYFNLGFDVIVVPTSFQSLLWPTIGIKSLRHLLEWLSNQKSEQPIIIHGLSAGAYVHNQLMRQMQIGPEKYLDVGSRIVGQIYDCAFLDIPSVDNAVGNLLPPVPGLVKFVRGVCKLYLDTLFYANTRWYYEAAEFYFYPNRWRIPGLMMHSSNDNIAVRPPIETAMECWDSCNIANTRRMWDTKGHVLNYYYHKDEYEELISAFLQSPDLKDALSKPK